MSNTIATPTVPQQRFAAALRALADFLEATPVPASIYTRVSSGKTDVEFHTHSLDKATETLIKVGGDEALYIVPEPLTCSQYVKMPDRFGFDEVTVFVPNSYEPVIVAEIIDPAVLIEEQMAVEA